MNINVIEATRTSVEASLMASNKDFLDFYALPFVQDMDKEHALTLFSCMKLVSFERGEVIYRAGEASVGRMHILLEGKVVVTSESGYKYSSLRQGGVFGLFSFLDDKRTHSATLTVERDVRVLVLERNLFDLMALEEPKLANQWLRFMFSLLSKKALEMEFEYANIHNFAFGGKV